MMFDLALWLAWPSLFLEYIALIEAPDPLLAVFLLMESCALSRVSMAAVKLSDGSMLMRTSVRTVPKKWEHRARFVISSSNAQRQ